MSETNIKRRLRTSTAYCALSFFLFKKGKIQKYKLLDRKLVELIRYHSLKDNAIRRRMYRSLQKRLRAGATNLTRNGLYLGTNDFSTIEFPVHLNPLVSIIIPVYNQYPITRACLESIYRSVSNTCSFEVIIADDGSTDRTREIDNEFKNIQVIKTEINSGFLRNCNNAAKYAKGKYLLFLNNDTIVQTQWLEALVDHAEQHPETAIAGSKLLYYKGDALMLQEAGGIVFADASAMNFGRDDSFDAHEYNYVKKCDYVSGASMLVRKTFWDSCNGFDETFCPAYYEDTDLCFQARMKGFETVYVPNSVVIHLEGVSNGTSTSSGLKQYQVINRDRFLSKWKDTLQAENHTKENIFNSKDRTNERKNVVVIDSSVPEHDKNAGARATDQYIDLLLKHGFNVKILTINNSSANAVNRYQSKGIEVIFGNDAFTNWKRWIFNNAANIDFFFINRPSVAEIFIDYIKKNTNTRILFQGHDLHFLRMKREHDILGTKKALSDYRKYYALEKRILEKCDFSFYFSQEEVDNVRKEFGLNNVVKVPLYIYEQVKHHDFVIGNRNDLLFVGGFKHSPNIDAMHYFLDDIFPAVSRALDSVKLYIVGSNAPKDLLEKASQNVVFTGYISDEEMQNLYDTARIVVAPLRYGAGVKGKIIEAMYNQVPVITTSIGAEGIANAEQCMLIADDPDTFSSTIINTYTDEVQLRKMSNNSFNAICDDFSVDCAVRSFISKFESPSLDCVSTKSQD